MTLRTPLAAAFLAAAYLSWPGAALAHKVNVFAVAEAGALAGEGYYANGSKAQGCPVELRDASGRVAATARTGKDGSFRLELPPGLTPPLTLVLKAGDGHQADYTLTAADLGPAAVQAASGGTAQPQAPASAAAEPGQTPPAQAASAQAASPAGSASVPTAQGVAQAAPSPTVQALPLDEARLQALVERAAAKAVEEKLAPLRLELARMAAQAEGNRVRDIAGGLGWIAGLAGLAAWFKRRR